MILKHLAVRPLMANCYIVGCDRTLKAAVIDPGGDSDLILRTLAESRLTLVYIIDTHGHFDHVGGNAPLKKATGADLLIHRAEAPMLDHLSQSAAAMGLRVEDSPAPDRLLEDGDEIAFGDIVLQVIHTPGHSPGGISLFEPQAGALFVGDTLFAGSVGRTDFPGGDFNTLKESIQRKLFVLGDEVKVYPGHMGPTTIGTEKQYNPFVAVGR